MIVSFYYYIDKKHNFRKCKEIIYFIVFSYMISLQFNIFLKISQGSTVTYFIKTKYFGKTNFKIIKKCCVTEHLCNTASFFLTIYFMRSIHRITLFALFDLWIHRIGQDHVDKIGGNYFLHHARRHFRRNSLLITFYKHRQNIRAKSFKQQQWLYLICGNFQYRKNSFPQCIFYLLLKLWVTGGTQ